MSRKKFHEYLTMADLGNAIEACTVAIDEVRCLMASNLPLGSRAMQARATWSSAEQKDFEDWTDQIKRFQSVRKKLLALETA